jgi:hypothetical protein
MAVFSMVVTLYYRPHVDPRDGQIYMVGALIIFLSMFLSLAMRTDVSNETHYSQSVFAVVLVVLNGVMLTAACFQVLLVGYRAMRSDNTTAPARAPAAAVRHCSDRSLTPERTVSTAAVAAAVRDVELADRTSSSHKYADHEQQQ